MKPIALALAALSFFACSRRPPYTLIPYGQAQPSKQSGAAIEVYSVSRPEKPFKEIGEVTTTATNPEVAMRFILDGAREIGADGVILAGPAGVAVSKSAIRGKAEKTKEYGARAVAIVYLPE